MVTPWLAEREIMGVASLVSFGPSRDRRGRMPTFQFVTTDGRELGPTELGRPDWPVGSTIYRGGPQPNLRVVDRPEPQPACRQCSSSRKEAPRRVWQQNGNPETGGWRSAPQFYAARTFRRSASAGARLAAQTMIAELKAIQK